MDGLIVTETPEGKFPTMVAAFAGWPDAAEAATGAIRYLVKRLPATKFAEIDPEDFYDFTAVRPETRLDAEGERVIRWQANDFFYYAGDDPSRNLILYIGTEPNLRWRTFSGLILNIAEQTGVELVVTLGDYFVARGSRPHVTGVRFQGAESAEATPEVAEAIESAEVIVYCPSNPIVSLGPILAIEGIGGRLRSAAAPRVGVSPIIGGAALRGPAADMLKGLGHEVSARGVAGILSDYLDGFVIDLEDASLLPTFQELGIEARALPSVMTDLSSKKRLAEDVLEFAGAIRAAAE